MDHAIGALYRSVQSPLAICGFTCCAMNAAWCACAAGWDRGVLGQKRSLAVIYTTCRSRKKIGRHAQNAGFSGMGVKSGRELG